MREDTINDFYLWCLNKTIDVKRTKDKYRDILYILDVNLKLKNISIHTEKKIKGLKLIIESIIEGNTKSYAIDNLIQSPRYDDSNSFIESMETTPITKERFLEIVKTIDVFYKLATVKKEVPKVQDLIDVINGESFNTAEESYEIFKNLIQELNMAVNKTERNFINKSEAIVTLGKDDIIKDLNKMNDRFDSTKKIPTGFSYIDDVILFGGFEKSRLYLFGGTSGSGKSTLLVNLALNAASTTKYTGELKTKLKVFPYISLENDRIETERRIMCALWDIDEIEFDRRRTTDPEKLNKDLQEYLEDKNAAIQICEYPSGMLSTLDLEVLIDDIVDQYGGKDKCVVPAIYIDYLDLLNGVKKLKDHRLDLSDITVNLRDLAKRLQIPIITATQLNKEGYAVKSSYDISATQISESMGKVHASSFVGGIVKDDFDTTLVHFRVVKFNNGPSGHALDLKVNFNHFKFTGCKPSKPPKGKDKVSFDGISQLDKILEVDDPSKPFGSIPTF